MAPIDLAEEDESFEFMPKTQSYKKNLRFLKSSLVLANLSNEKTIQKIRVI